MPILVDTNVLLRSREPAHPESTRCQQALLFVPSRGESLVLCPQVIVEYWAAATRPRVANGLGLSAAEADQDLRAFETALAPLPDPPALLGTWRDLVRSHSVLGRQVYDARIAAYMMASGIDRLLTLNEPDFRRFPSVRCSSPAELLAEMGIP